ncbi:MAG: D-isomer specific 2-hydroxyacid dehydrogenase family protein [Acidimicrobiales bacterium]
MSRSIAVAPGTLVEMHDAFVAAVVRAGGTIAPLSTATGLIWADPGAAASFPNVVAQMPNLEWVQLPYAGVETFGTYLDPAYTFTCGKGSYALPVAEHVITLALAGLRNIWRFSNATSWGERTGRNLLGANITILGAGGIASEVVRLLEPWRCRVTVVRRSATQFPGAAQTMAVSNLHDAVATADVVVVAWALTEQTRGLVDANALAAMRDDAWLINVGRGCHVVTADLVAALESGTIAGAALDVTDPEPLPAGHPLWAIPNCIITPHVANTAEMGLPLIAQRVEENTRRYLNNQPFVGLVDIDAGY